MTVLWKKIGDYIVRKGEPSRPARKGARGQLARVVAYTAQSTDIGNRFPGDPGVSRFYFGGREDTVTWTDSETAIANWESRMAPWSSNRKISIVRVVADASTTTGFTRVADMQRHYDHDRLPHVSFKLPSTFGSTPTAQAAKAVLFDSAWTSWMNALSTQILAFAPNPVWWTFWPEPVVDFPNATLAAQYRTIQRRIVTDLKNHGVTNHCFVPACLRAPFDFGGAGGTTDWRLYYPDWKGTTTNAGGHTGAKDDPNPSDFYVGTDPSSVVNVMGIDLYQTWSAAMYPGQEGDVDGKTADSATNYSDFPGLWTKVKDRMDFLSKPYAIAAFGLEAYHTGAYVPPGVTPAPDLSGVGGAATFSTTMDNKTKDTIKGTFDDMLVDNIVALEVENGPVTHSPLRLEYADLNRARYEGYGRGMARAEFVAPDFQTGGTPTPLPDYPYFGAAILSGGANGVVTKWGGKPSIRQYGSGTLTPPSVFPSGCLMHMSYKAYGNTYTDAQIDALLRAMGGHIVSINHEPDNGDVDTAHIPNMIAMMNRFYDRNVAIGRPCLMAPTFTGGLFASYGTDAKRDAWMATTKGDLLGIDCDGIHDNATTKPSDLVYRKNGGVITYSDEIANGKRYIKKYPNNGWIGLTVPEFGISRASWDTNGAGRAQWIQRNSDMFVSEGVFAVQWFDTTDSATGISDILNAGTADFSMFQSYVAANTTYVPFAA